MQSVSKYIIICIILLMAVIQLVPVSRTNPPVISEIQAPDNVKVILKTSCYDCHSNETIWPWYSKVAPASWLVISDVDEAREEMNFSTWGQYSQKKKNEKLEEIWEEVGEEHMPLWQYVIMHPEAGLSEQDKKILQEWVSNSLPPGSLSEHK